MFKFCHVCKQRWKMGKRVILLCVTVIALCFSFCPDAKSTPMFYDDDQIAIRLFKKPCLSTTNQTNNVRKDGDVKGEDFPITSHQIVSNIEAIGKPREFRTRHERLPHSVIIGGMIICMITGPLLVVIGLLQILYHRLVPSAKAAKYSDAHGSGNTSYPSFPIPFDLIKEGFNSSPKGKIHIGLQLIAISFFIFGMWYLLYRYAGYEHPKNFGYREQTTLEVEGKN